MLIWGCQAPTTDKTEEMDTPDQQAEKLKWPEQLQASLDAHGGIATWNKQQTLKYTIGINDQKELQIIDLPTRKVRIEHPEYTIGYDGREVWVAPNKMAYREGKSSARFYHNLNFYFFAIPFVLTDPGIQYELLPSDSINGVNYDRLKISFEEGVGDAPDDYYICYFDQKTHQLTWLMYTVTYYSGEKNERFSLIKYENWDQVDGLLVPQKIIGYRWKNGQLGEQRYEKTFEEIRFSTKAESAQTYEMPGLAEIDSLILH